MNLLVDTNILLYLLNGDEKISTILSQSVVHISFITELELLCYPNLKEKESAAIHSLLAESKIYDINSQIKKNCIKIRKAYRLKLPDAIIGATALSFNLTLFSNDSDFQRIKEIDTVNYQV